MRSKKTWSSQFNFIMATIGAAVGLGSIWKFPYMAGDNGGSAFVLLYLLATFAIGVPIMIAEILLGKLSRKNPINAMRDLAIKENASKNWQIVGIIGAISLILVLSFYSVIAGWSIAYMIKTWSGQLSNLSSAAINNVWANFLENPLELLIWHSIFMFLTIFTVSKDINKGIEKASRIMMPGLFIILIVLMIYSGYVGDLAKATSFLLKPDFSKLNSHVMLVALGQAAFALATGAGAMLVYGSYVAKDTKIINDVLIIAFAIILVSLLSGFAIFPIVFGFNLPEQGGPGLMFQVLPLAFNKMPFGIFFGGLFFLMLFFAGWTSSISMAEPLIVILMEKFNLTRVKSAIIIGFITWSLGILALLSFNNMQNIRLFGKYDIFTAMTDVTTNILLPVGMFAFAVFAGWKLNSKTAKEGLLVKSKTIFMIWKILVKYIAPLGILLLFIINQK